MSPFFIRKQDEPRWFFGLKIAGVVILGIIAAAAFAVLFGYIVMWLWNWLLPTLFGFKAITFWQAVGIVILAKIIFGNTCHRSGRYHRSRHYGCRSHNRQRWYEKWELYDDFWKEEGEKAFNDYVGRHQAKA
jgi:hypothetical protein